MKTSETKSCGHQSVGILVLKDERVLLGKRKIPPLAFAPPAGHVDLGESFEGAARRELFEETGLFSETLRLVAQGRKDNPCSREGGSWHVWKIYSANHVSGTLVPENDELELIDLYDKARARSLAERTRAYLLGEVREDEWQKEPGLEPVWLEWFLELKIL